jgi:hypothetical protein
MILHALTGAAPAEYFLVQVQVVVRQGDLPYCVGLVLSTAHPITA